MAERRAGSQNAPKASTCSASSGHHERDGQLPGQVWLWLYTLWYQVEPIKSSTSADAWVIVHHRRTLSLAFPLHPLPAHADQRACRAASTHYILSRYPDRRRTSSAASAAAPAPPAPAATDAAAGRLPNPRFRSSRAPSPRSGHARARSRRARRAWRGAASACGCAAGAVSTVRTDRKSCAAISELGVPERDQPAAPRPRALRGHPGGHRRRLGG